MLKHGSLFSGIGGFDLAAEWMGWENIFHCEWNEFGKRVLNYYWPNAISYDDITKTDFTIWRGRIDVLSGGFPCQPYSVAGKRKGKDDARHLWPEMLRAIREIAPTYVVGENVSGIINWNNGLVFHEVQSDLENEGYEVQPFVLPACAVNAPHRRDRVWFIAYSHENRGRARRSGCNRETENTAIGGNIFVQPERFSKIGAVANSGLFRQEVGQIEAMGFKQFCQEWADTHSEGKQSERIELRGQREISLQEQRELRRIYCKAPFTDTQRERRGEILHYLQRKQSNGQIVNASYEQTNWENFPTQPPVCSGDDGLSSELDGITFPKWRAESVKAYGNAIVPQVALQIFKAIQIIETYSK